MKIGIIGSGVVAQTLGAKLIELGHDVVLGTRDPAKLDEKKNMAGTLREWIANARAERRARSRRFQEAAAHGELLFNATHGQASIEALKLAGADKVGAKVLIDTGNELDFSKGMPPGALASQSNCLAERIQAAFPESEGGQVAEHDRRAGDGRAAGAGRRRAHGVRVGQRHAGQGRRRGGAEVVRLEGRARSGRHLRRRAARRCTWRCGCGCGARPAPAWSTSRSCADGAGVAPTISIACSRRRPPGSSRSGSGSSRR